MAYILLKECSRQFYIHVLEASMYCVAALVSAECFTAWHKGGGVPAQINTASVLSLGEMIYKLVSFQSFMALLPLGHNVICQFTNQHYCSNEGAQLNHICKFDLFSGGHRSWVIQWCYCSNLGRIPARIFDCQQCIFGHTRLQFKIKVISMNLTYLLYVILIGHWMLPL